MKRPAPSTQRKPASIFFFNDTATTEIYTLSLHDALPISRIRARRCSSAAACSASRNFRVSSVVCPPNNSALRRSEEHTSGLQSLTNLIFRHLLLINQLGFKYDITAGRHRGVHMRNERALE